MSSSSKRELSVFEIAKSMKPALVKGSCGICCRDNVPMLKCHQSGCRDACVSCHQTYIETNAAQFPHCMFDRNHRFEWKFLNQNFPRQWIKGPLAQKRAEQLAQDQAVKLPMLQEIASTYRDLVKIYDPECQRPCEDVFRDLKDSMKEVYEMEVALKKAKNKRRSYEEEFDAIIHRRRKYGQDLLASSEQISQMEKQLAFHEREAMKKLKGEIAELEFKAWNKTLILDVEAEEPVFHVLCNCPADRCNGYAMIQNQSGFAECKMCDSLVCVKCQKLVTVSDHTCNPDDLESIQLIRQTTKNCPWEGCGAAITKTEGCHQMFCTKCKGGFHWDTLRKVMPGESFHNPHHSAYIAANMNNDSDPELEGGGGPVRPMRWGRVLDFHIRNNTSIEINKRQLCKSGIQTILWNVNRIYAGFHGATARKTKYFKLDLHAEFKLVNVRKVAGDISEEQWNRELVKIDNHRKFNNDIHSNVMTLVYETWTTYRDFRRLALAIAPGETRDHFDSVVRERLEQLDNSRIRINEELVRVSNEHNGRNYPNFDQMFYLMDMNHRNEMKIAKEAEGIEPRSKKVKKTDAGPSTLATAVESTIIILDEDDDLF